MRLQKALPRKKVVERVWFSKDILRKSDGVCAHCGCPVAIGDNFTVEHVVPISKGGTLCKTLFRFEDKYGMHSIVTSFKGYWK